MRQAFCSAVGVLLLSANASTVSAATIGTFDFRELGTVVVEFYDDEKPVTVSNFVKYVTSGRYEDLIVHRWEPNFVIQAGGYTVGEDPEGGPEFREVQSFGTITNEYSVGETYSNAYGTIAMARVGGQANSATSEWFFNNKDNPHLDGVDGGFTVFGRVISGTNVLNLFVPPPPQNGIHRAQVPPYLNAYGEFVRMDALPVLATNANFDDLVYVDIHLRRDMDVRLERLRGVPRISWESVSGVTNTVEYTSDLSAGNWQVLTNVIGTGGRMSIGDSLSHDKRHYRVGLVY